MFYIYSHCNKFCFGITTLHVDLILCVYSVIVCGLF